MTCKWKSDWITWDLRKQPLLKMWKAERPWKYSRYQDLIAIIDSLLFLIDSLGPAFTQHVIHPFLSPILPLCRDSIPISVVPLSTLFLSLPKLYSLPLFAFPCKAHTHTHTKKTNYNTAKSIWEQQASHSVGEGGWNACCHQTSKLQHVKPRPTACPVQQWDHSSAMCTDLIVRGTLL